MFSEQENLKKKLSLLIFEEQTLTNSPLLMPCRLLLSNVVNLMDNSMHLALKDIFSPRQLEFLNEHDTFETNYGLDLPSLALLDNIVDNW